MALHKIKKPPYTNVMLLLINCSVKAPSPVNKIWYPEVAEADLGSIGKFSITTIKNVPAPTPNIPCTNPAPNPPRTIFQYYVLLYK
jgi:hypothetical protein